MPTGSLWGRGGNFTYHVFRYQFYMDAAVTPGSFNLNLDFYTDDLMRRVFVNDELIQDFVVKDDADGTAGAGGFRSSNRTNVALNKGWKYAAPGSTAPVLNSIYLVISNYNTPVGLLAQSGGTAACAPDVFVTKKAYKYIPVDNANGESPVPFTGDATPNAAVEYEITVNNQSLNEIADLPLTDVLPDGLNAAASTWQCKVPQGGVATCPTPSSGNFSASRTMTSTMTLPPGSSLVYRIKSQLNADLSATPVITNTAKISPTNAALCNAKDGFPTPCEGSATLTTGPAASIAKTVSPVRTLYSGETATFTITATNESGSTFASMKIEDSLPPEFESGTWTCEAPAGSLALCPNASGTLSGTPLKLSEDTASAGAPAAGEQDKRLVPANSSLVYKVTAKLKALTSSGSLTNTATLTPALADPATPWRCRQADGTYPAAASQTACSAEVKVPVAIGAPVLRLAHIATPLTVEVGGSSEFKITVKNLSGSDIDDGVLALGAADNLTLGSWTCTVPTGSAAACPANMQRLSKSAAADIATGLNLPVGSSLEFTATGTLDPILQVGQSVELPATLTSQASGVTCDPTCSQKAKVTVKGGRAGGGGGGGAGGATPVPVDSAWMLAALSSLLLAGAAVAQRRMQRARTGGKQGK